MQTGSENICGRSGTRVAPAESFSGIVLPETFSKRSPGQWQTYIPGPTLPLPWEHSDDATGVAAHASGDAVPGNGAPFVSDSRFVLLAPPKGAAG